MTKVVVIGLDGAGFHLLDQWLNEETLPTLNNLMENGTWDSLRSSYPPVTSPAWRCYSTGVNPGKHGVFWWEQFDRQSRTLTIPDSRSYDAKNIWDYLGEAGFSSAVVNMPTTHPPEELYGWMVSGGGFEEGYTYPETLQQELEEAIGYSNHLPVHKQLIKEDPDRVQEVNQLIDQKFNAAAYLRDEYQPDFLHLSLFITNSIQHYVWGGEATKRMWECVDRNIREFINDDENVIIMSDHGSQRIETVFHINSWLEAEGYLSTKRTASDYLHLLNINTESLIGIVERLGLKEVARALVPKQVVSQIPDSQGGIGRDSKAEKIDWDNSQAFASGQGPIYVLETGSRRDDIAAEIKSKLENLKSPDGNSIARNVFAADEVYSGPYVKEGPDLIIDQAEVVHIPDVVGSPNVFVDPKEWKWESENHRDGIFIASGPDVNDVGKLDSKLTIYDLAPTILHWYDIVIPNDFDGRVLSEIYREDSTPYANDEKYSDIEIHQQSTDKIDGTDEMEDRLKDLGYLS